MLNKKLTTCFISIRNSQKVFQKVQKISYRKFCKNLKNSIQFENLKELSIEM